MITFFIILLAVILLPILATIIDEIVAWVIRKRNIYK